MKACELNDKHQIKKRMSNKSKTGKYWKVKNIPAWVNPLKLCWDVCKRESYLTSFIVATLNFVES